METLKMNDDAKLYFRYDKDNGKFLNTRNDH